MLKIINNKTSESNTTDLNFIYNSYSVQIYNTTKDGIDETEKTALDNSLSILNFTNCESFLKKAYDIPSNESLIIYKIDYNKNISDPLNNHSMNIAYNVFDKSGKQLDLNYCENINIGIKIPVSNIENSDSINKTLYAEYNSNGIDLYDNTSDFYNNFCYSYNISDKDITLNDRRSSIFQNVSIKCSGDCVYSGIDIYDYVNCNCPVTNKTEVSADIVKGFLSALTESNFMIIQCYQNILNVVNIIIYYKNRNNSKAIGGSTLFWFLEFCLLYFIFHFFMTRR